MKKFLKYIIAFIIPVLLMAVALEFYLRSIPNSYKYKNEWMLKNSDSLQVIAIGSSHAYYGIDPTFLKEKGFNLGNSSQDLEMDRFLIEKYSNNAKNLKCVLLVLSDISLLSDMEHGAESWRIPYYGIYMGYPPKRFALEITNARMIDKLTAYFKGTDMRSCSTLGFGIAYSTAAKPEWNKEDAKAAAKRNTAINTDGSIDTSLLNKNLACLDSLASLCERNDIRLCVLRTPYSKEYLEVIDKAQNAFFLKIINRKLLEHKGMSFHDFSADPRFSGEDFYDCDHLSDKGARKFTSIISSEVIHSY